MKYKIMNYGFRVLCFVTLSIAITIFMLANKSYHTASQKILDFEDETINSVSLRVSDRYGGDQKQSLADFFAEEQSLSRMQTFNQKLHEQFDFYELNTQALCIVEEFQYKDEFREDYGTRFYGMNDDAEIRLFSMQMDNVAYNTFHLEQAIAEGRGFERTDYTADSMDLSVPAILGSEYRGLVQIGDTITMQYLFKDISVNVVGFFQENTSVTANNQTFFLDRYILIPSLEMRNAPTTEEDAHFQKIVYSLKNWGYIKANKGEDFNTYKNAVDQLSQDLQLKYILNEVYVLSYITNIANTLHSSVGLFFVLSLVLFVTLLIVFVYLYLFHFERNKKSYAVHLICGCSFTRLKMKIYLGAFLLFAASFLASIGLNHLLLGHKRLYAMELFLLKQASLQTLLLSLFALMVVCFTLHRRIHKNDIYACIQKEN